MRVLRKLNNTSNRNVVSLVAATAIAQGIQLAATPFLTRMYGPEHYAPFQLFTSLAAVLAVISTLRYELAIVITGNEKDALLIFSLSAGIASIIAVLSGIGLLASELIGITQFGYIFIAGVPIYVLASGLQQVGNNWSIRKGTFIRNVIARVFGALTQSVTGLLLGAIGYLSTGLIVGLIAAQLISASILIRKTIDAPSLWFRKLRSKEGHQLLKHHDKFPKFNTLHSLLDVLQDHGIIFLFSIFYPNSLMAFYGQAFRLLKAPVGFIGTAIYQVFFPDFTRRWQAGEDLRPTIRKFYIKLFLSALPFFGAMAWFAIPIFRWFLGEDWTFVGNISSILMPWMFLNFIASPLSSLPIIASRQGTAVFLAALEFTCRCIGVIIAGLWGNSMIAIAALSFIGCLFTLINMVWYHQLANKK